MQLFRVSGGSQPAEYLLRSLFVVFPSPAFDLGSGMRQAGKPVFVEAFIAKPSVERFDVGVLIRLPGSIRRSCAPRSCTHAAMAFLQNSFPLSLRMIFGRPPSDSRAIHDTRDADT
jgi:hypothetical protein